jgi:hypothetical protein
MSHDIPPPRDTPRASECAPHRAVRAEPPPASPDKSPREQAPKRHCFEENEEPAHRVFCSRVCANCDADTPESVCSRCLSAAYCNERCQSAHWRSHRTVCLQLAKTRLVRIRSCPITSVPEAMSELMRFGDVARAVLYLFAKLSADAASRQAVHTALAQRSGYMCLVNGLCLCTEASCARPTMRLLDAMVAGEPGLGVLLVADGIGPFLLRSLRTFRESSPDVVLACLQLLVTLAGFGANRVALMNLGVGRETLALITLHRYSPGIAEAGCALIQRLARDEACRNLLLNLGAIHVVQSVIMAASTQSRKALVCLCNVQSASPAA